LAPEYAIYTRTVAASGTPGVLTQLGLSENGFLALAENANGVGAVVWEAPNVGTPRPVEAWQGPDLAEVTLLGQPSDAEPQTISLPGQVIYYVNAAAGANGSVLVSWTAARCPSGTSTCLRPVGSTLYVRWLSATGVLGPVVQVASAVASAYSESVLAVDSSQRGVVVWRSAASRRTIQLRTIAAAGTLGPVTTITRNAEHMVAPVVALDGSGHGSVVWFDGAFDHGARVVARAISSTGQLGPDQVISRDSRSAGAQLAVDASGNTVVVWSDETSTSSNEYIDARVLQRSGKLGPTRVLIPAEAGYLRPGVAITPDGRGLVVWYGCSGLCVRPMTTASTVGPTQQILDSTDILNAPQAALTSNGQAIVLIPGTAEVAQVQLPSSVTRK
jgi:hypothetical protein